MELPRSLLGNIEDGKRNGVTDWSITGRTFSWRSKHGQLRGKQLPGEKAIVSGARWAVSKHDEPDHGSVRETQVAEVAGKMYAAACAGDVAVHTAKHPNRAIGWQDEIWVRTKSRSSSSVVSAFRWVIEISKPDGIGVTRGMVFRTH